MKAALKQFHGALEAIEKLERESEVEAQAAIALTNQVSKQQAAIAKLEADSAWHKAAAEELRIQVENQKAEIERLRAELAQQRAEKDSAMKQAAESTNKALSK